MSAQTPELLPCPFCGDPNPAMQGENDPHLNVEQSAWVECDTCGVQARAFSRMSDAADAWNRRQLSAQGEEVDSPWFKRLESLVGNPKVPEAISNDLAMALKTLRAPAAGDWQWVPKEPTESMWDAAWKSIGLPYRAKLSLHEIKTLFDKFHAAMLSAAPPVPSEISHDIICKEADGCPTELAVLQRFWRAHKAPSAKGWAIKGPDGRIDMETFCDLEKDAIEVVCDFRDENWQDLQRDGYTCVSVTITEDKA